MRQVYFLYNMHEETTLNGHKVFHNKFVVCLGEIITFKSILNCPLIRLSGSDEEVIVHKAHIANTENDAVEMAKQKNKEIMDNLKIELSKCLSQINWLSKECNLNA